MMMMMTYQNQNVNVAKEQAIPGSDSHYYDNIFYHCPVSTTTKMLTYNDLKQSKQAEVAESTTTFVIFFTYYKTFH